MIATLGTQPPKPPAPSEKINVGMAVSVVCHAALIACLLCLVHPRAPVGAPAPALPKVIYTPPAPIPSPPQPLDHPIRRTATAQPRTTETTHVIETRDPATTSTMEPANPPLQAVADTPDTTHPHVVGKTVPPAYFNSLEALIQKSAHYPAQSLADQEEGDCLVRVSFSRDGGIADAVLIQKSGSPALDGECREVFKRIGRFPPLPAEVAPQATDFSIELPISFTLSE